MGNNCVVFIVFMYTGRNREFIMREEGMVIEGRNVVIEAFRSGKTIDTIP